MLTFFWRVSFDRSLVPSEFFPPPASAVFASELYAAVRVERIRQTTQVYARPRTSGNRIEGVRECLRRAKEVIGDVAPRCLVDMRHVLPAPTDAV